ncbi:SUN domain-containing protein 1 isoform X1 [Gadus macrocephalus]|uniref:SUN domain-containing protein 1 isoform X1 n=2 Tax=Gadus macrocephalus TaxID=80720 RepID=UPI0028CB8577|nr:SUN domain-containing protein 1 isoform X1 [Gadus macrocephalus]
MNTDDEEGTLECWGWTDLYWWAVLDEERSDQPERPCPRPPAAMSRRSLRIHTPPHERGSPYGSASFSLGVPPRSEQTPSIKNSSKSLRRPHLSVSCSQSLLQTPRRPSLHQQHLDSSLHSVASDASLISSMLDESSYQERTLMDSYWGLDDDEDPQDSTILLEHSTALSNSTLVGSGDGRCHSIPAQTQTSMVNGHPRRDYSLPAERKQGPSALHSSAKFPNPSSRLPVGPSSALYSGAQHQGTSVSPAATSPTSIIYCRDKSRKGKPGVFVSMWDSVRRVCRKTAASLALLLTLIYKYVLLKMHLDHEGVVPWILAVGREAKVSAVSILNLGLQVFRRSGSQVRQAVLHGWDHWRLRPADAGIGKLASSRSGGDMDSAGPGDQKQNSSLSGDDPKDKPTQPPTIVASSSSPSSSPFSSSDSFLSSVLYLLLGLLWIASSSAGAYVWQLAQRAGSAGWVVTKKRLSDLRESGPSAGQVGSSVLRWLERGWYHTSSFMSLLKNFLLVWCLPNLFRIALLLLLLLLLSALLGWWDPRDVLSSMLPVDGSDWRDALPLTSFPGLAAMLKPPQEGSGQAAPSPPDQAGPSPLDRSTDLQVFTEPPPPYLLPPAMEEKDEAGEGEAASSGDSERLRLLEQSLAQLWEHVEDSGHRAERMHGEVLGLYQGLRRRQQQLVVVEPDQVEADRASLEPWLDGLLEDKLAEMKLRLDEDRLHREQTRKQYMAQQKSQAFRMAELEQLLQALTAKMEEVQQRQEAVATTTTTLRPTSASRQQTSVSGVDSEFHDALRSDVSRLETALGDVRQDLNGLRGCQDHCHRLDNIQETLFSQVRAQVREELRALLYGNQLVSLSQTDSPDDGADDPAALPDSLLEWLAERYVSGADLRASLASLELSILRNVSKQLEQRRGEQVDEEEEEEEDDHNQRQTVVTQTVVDSLNAAGAGVTEEEVQLMVRNALRLYSQDRTGLADYALESGGGSILSTRCSETYETRTALLSLFGLPLWYFSQSPRVVIQPDVQPGNCWAFRGSTGYLVIRLSMKVQPTAFTLEHIPKALAPSGALRSAPRDFTVYGLDDEGQEEGQLLGSYSYEEDGEAVQTYHVTEEKEQAFQIIEVRILSNWGNQEYTCMYRLRVHGIPSND